MRSLHRYIVAKHGTESIVFNDWHCIGDGLDTITMIKYLVVGTRYILHIREEDNYDISAIIQCRNIRVYPNRRNARINLGGEKILFSIQIDRYAYYYNMIVAEDRAFDHKQREMCVLYKLNTESLNSTDRERLLWRTPAITIKKY